MTRIATYVFLDVQTTGLSNYECNKTYITEINITALKRRHIVHGEGGLPRVAPKLTINCNPGQTISPEAAIKSGLNNDLLEYEPIFNMDIFDLIKTFLKLQEKPICLIAHNGYDFHFPILKNHIECLKMRLPEDIMCADSLYAFYDIMTNKVANIFETSILSTCILNETVDDSGCDVKKSFSKTKKAKGHAKMSQMSEINFKPARRFRNVLRERYYENDEYRKSYKLPDVYERVVGRPADEVCLTNSERVAEIATEMADVFIKWIDRNHCAFAEVEPMPI